MPVTVKLSRKFYETFGDELANELVEWFNQVDATYRTDLRELNELNFSRFDAKLEQRVAELDAKLESQIAAVRGDMNVGFAQVAQQMSELKAELIRWMFLFWAGTTFTVLGVMIALLKL
jgi:ABC-type phosphate transport system auxiliary subunit